MIEFESYMEPIRVKPKLMTDFVGASVLESLEADMQIEPAKGGEKVIDLMEALRASLAKKEPAT